MAAENETLKFKIGEDEYEIPGLDDLDMDEWQILYDYTGLILDDFAPQEDEDEERDRQRRTSQPGFTRAMLHIGYRRAHPDLKPDAIRQVTGAAKLLSVLEAMGESAGNGEEAEESPLASTTELAPSSPRSSVDSNETESESSQKSSAEPDVRPYLLGRTHRPCVSRHQPRERRHLDPRRPHARVTIFDALFPGEEE
jgi:hypothetical protein